jgi:hypothetical protein
MRAQKIAGKKYALLGQIGEYRIRPVYPGSMNELQALIPKRDLLAVFCFLHSVLAHQVKQHKQVQALGGAYHFGIRIYLKEPFKTSRMVLFSMLGDDVVYLMPNTQVAQQHIGH